MSAGTRTNQRGFTLGEIMVCLLILSIAVLGLVCSLSFSVRATGGNRELHTASVIAYSFLTAAESRARQLDDFDASMALPRSPVPGEQGYEYALEDEHTRGTDERWLTVTVWYREQNVDHRYQARTLVYRYATD